MAHESAPPRPDGLSLEEVLAAYLEAEDAGGSPDRGAWLTSHPELAAELAQFFTNHDQLVPLLKGLGELGYVPEGG